MPSDREELAKLLRSIGVIIMPTDEAVDRLLPWVKAKVDAAVAAERERCANPPAECPHGKHQPCAECALVAKATEPPAITSAIEEARPTPSHYHAHPDGTFTICDCAGEKP